MQFTSSQPFFMEALTTSVNNLTGSGITGATTLANGNLGGVAVFFLALFILLALIGAIYAVFHFAKKH